MKSRYTMLASCLALALALAPTDASAKLSCPKAGQKKLKIYAIGSSTMGMSLGTVLKAELGAEGAEVRIWGKASSGLARPDFHDWPEKVPDVIAKHDPDAFVVSLGTNDGQPLKEGRKWIDFGSASWKRIYGERVDALLTAAAGAEKSRPVIWLGPTAHPNRKFTKRMHVIRDIVKARIDAFRGNVVFVDALTATLGTDGRVKKHFKLPGSKKLAAATQPDGVHLTPQGVRWLLAAPIVGALKPCLGAKAAKGTGTGAGAGARTGAGANARGGKS